ncbi:MAG TPA: hypothetical protein VGC04_04555 [Cellulomonas sp.]
MFLLGVELVDLLVQLVLEEPLGLLLVGDGVVHGLADELDELVAEVLAAVVVLDGFLDPVDVVVRLVADALGAVRAEEVEVLTAVASDDVLDQQTLVDAAQPLALAAVDGALQEVVVSAPPFAGDPA